MKDHQSPFLITEEAATYLRRPQETLRQWRHRGVGPKSFKIGGRVVYRREDIERWIAEQEAHTSAGGAA